MNLGYQLDADDPDFERLIHLMVGLGYDCVEVSTSNPVNSFSHICHASDIIKIAALGTGSYFRKHGDHDFYNKMLPKYITICDFVDCPLIFGEALRFPLILKQPKGIDVYLESGIVENFEKIKSEYIWAKTLYDTFHQKGVIPADAEYVQISSSKRGLPYSEHHDFIKSYEGILVGEIFNEPNLSEMEKIIEFKKIVDNSKK